MPQIASRTYRTKYKYVRHEFVNNYEYYCINLPRVTKKRYKNLKDAALAVDLILIRQGKEPVNILKRI